MTPYSVLRALLGALLRTPPYVHTNLPSLVAEPRGEGPKRGGGRGRGGPTLLYPSSSTFILHYPPSTVRKRDPTSSDLRLDIDGLHGSWRMEWMTPSTNGLRARQAESMAWLTGRPWCSKYEYLSVQKVGRKLEVGITTQSLHTKSKYIAAHLS